MADEYAWDKNYGYLIKETEDRSIFVMPFMFTHAIVWFDRRRGDMSWYNDRWCYHTYAAATTAAENWSGEAGTEPEGWHRHPTTGRRREDGDPATETIRM